MGISGDFENICINFLLTFLIRILRNHGFHRQVAFMRGYLIVKSQASEDPYYEIYKEFINPFSKLPKIPFIR